MSPSIVRAKFRRWTELEDLRDKFTKAADVSDLANMLIEYLSAALDFDAYDLPWTQTAKLITDTLEVNAITRILPFMRYPVKSKPAVYDYPGRTFYTYAHMLAKHYGWSLEDIATLDVDEALALIQEILIDINHRMEWEWDLSEKSTGYDEQTKKSKHIPFPLPDWMTPAPTEPKKYRIPKALIPVGNVVSYRPDVEPA